MPLKRRIKRAIARTLGLAGNGAVQPLTGDEERALIADNFITEAEVARLKAGDATSSALMGKTISITDSFWYLHSLKEIFAEEVYQFRSSHSSPRILDCGSNIGLSVIYFKRLYPKARITAFEPDVRICEMLKGNLGAFGFADVVVENKAVWRANTVLSFSASGGLGGRLSEEKNSSTPMIEVPTVRLKDYLQQPTDFLKIDIEGPEVEVLDDCADSLVNVQHLFVEYHSDPETEQRLDHLLGILRKAGFRVYIKEAWNNLPYPFLRTDYNPCYDLQLNIFAYRSMGRVVS